MPPDFDDDVRVEIYRHLLNEGSTPTHLDIAEDLDLPPIEVEGAFRRLADDHVIVLAPGSPYLWMAHPFSAIPTSFTVRAAGRRWWGNCIWDALGILAMVGEDGSVEAHCPDCADPLSVSVTSGEVAGDHRYLVQFSIPAARWWDDIGAT